MSLPPIPTTVATAVANAAVDPSATSLTGRWWEQAEILLVADRQLGSTHRFFQDWRIEVVTGPDQAEPGRCLFASPVPGRTLANSGWRYTLLRLPDRPGFETLDTAAFSWTVNQSGQIPDPFAAAYKQADAWLAQARNESAAAAGPATSREANSLESRQVRSSASPLSVQLMESNDG